MYWLVHIENFEGVYNKGGLTTWKHLGHSSDISEVSLLYEIYKVVWDPKSYHLGVGE
jgi:hypothetical protein